MDKKKVSARETRALVVEVYVKSGDRASVEN
jgi:hypothetical protein